MFKIASFKTCPLTGAVDVTLLMNMGKEDIVDEKHFWKKEDADRWVDRMKAQYFIIKFERWLNHLRIVQEKGNNGYYNTARRLNSFENITRANQMMVEQPLRKMADILLRVEDDLYIILPQVSNASYLSSKSDLDKFLLFCKKHSTANTITVAS